MRLLDNHIPITKVAQKDDAPKVLRSNREYWDSDACSILEEARANHTSTAIGLTAYVFSGYDSQNNLLDSIEKLTLNEHNFQNV